MLDHVLVPLDESELSEKALDYALAVVNNTGKVSLLMVVDLPSMAYMVSPAMAPEIIMSQNEDYERMRDNMLTHAKDYLQHQRTKLMSSIEECDVTVRCGAPADVIVETADELGVKAIIMSTHGRSGFNKWVFGSVTEKVLKKSDKPVFVIPVRT